MDIWENPMIAKCVMDITLRKGPNFQKYFDIHSSRVADVVTEVA